MFFIVRYKTVSSVRQMSLGEEDLLVLMKILMENIEEGSKDHSMEITRQVAQGKLTVHDA